MPRLRLTKKLQPAKKSWRSFCNRVQSKVNELNIPRAIRTTIQRLVSTFHSFRHLISTKSRRHRSLPARPYSYYNISSSSSSYQHVQHNNFSAIRIDDLFAEPSASSSSSSFALSASGYAAKGELRSRGKAEMGNSKDLDGKGESSNNNNNGLDTLEDAWKVVVAKSPNLQVDEKAEEFIKKFHQDMKIQKERSLLEFQERLARST